jgi:hypothetical protein
MMLNVTCVEFLLFRTQEVLKEVEAMRQYEEDVDNLNEVAHNRPRAHLVLGKFVSYRTLHQCFESGFSQVSGSGSRFGIRIQIQEQDPVS